MPVRSGAGEVSQVPVRSGAGRGPAARAHDGLLQSQSHLRALLRLSLGGPFDHGRPYRGAQGVSLGIGQADTPHEQTQPHGAVHHGGRDRIEPQLRSPEQRETLCVIDSAPGQIDEPATRRTLDVRAPEIDAGRRRDHGAVHGPHGRRRVPGYQAKQLISPVPALDPDMDVVIPAGRVWARAAGASWKAECLNPDPHLIIIGRRGAQIVHFGREPAAAAEVEPKRPISWPGTRGSGPPDAAFGAASGVTSQGGGTPRRLCTPGCRYWPVFRALEQHPGVQSRRGVPPPWLVTPDAAPKAASGGPLPRVPGHEIGRFGSTSAAAAGSPPKWTICAPRRPIMMRCGSGLRHSAFQEAPAARAQTLPAGITTSMSGSSAGTGEMSCLAWYPGTRLLPCGPWTAP